MSQQQPCYTRGMELKWAFSVKREQFPESALSGMFKIHKNLQAFPNSLAPLCKQLISELPIIISSLRHITYKELEMLWYSP